MMGAKKVAMNDVWKFVKIQQSASDRVKHFWAAFATKGQRNFKGINAFPEDAEKKPLVRVNGKDFEGASGWQGQ